MNDKMINHASMLTVALCLLTLGLFSGDAKSHPQNQLLPAATSRPGDKIQNAGRLYKFQFAGDKKLSARTNRTKFHQKSAAIDELSPHSFKLYQNYPNPFNSRTFIKFELAQKSHLTIDVFDARGEHVSRLLSTVLAKGLYISPWNGTDEKGREMSSGVYFVRLAAENNHVEMKRMLLLR